VRYRRWVIYLVAGLVGLVFGAADQYLGSLRSFVALGPWTISVSQMSALWLLLPFVFGATQDRPRRAALVGVVATVAALLGYYAMTVSPMEGVALRHAPSAFAAVLPSNMIWIVGGFVTAPVCGYLGHRWRVSRWWLSAAIISGAFLLEPLARKVNGELFGPAWVWRAEVALGLGLAAGFVLAGMTRRTALARR
jgi:hypothetical protein